ncbi:MAG: ATP-binding protein [Acidimicrobiales bacterium]
MNRTVARNGVAYVVSSVFLAVLVVGHDTLIDRRAPTIDAVLQTSIALTGTLVALLVLGRYRRSADLSDLLIFIAVLLLAWVHTLFKVLPDLISPNSVGNGISERVEIWGGIMTKILAAWYLFRATLPGEPAHELGSSRSRRYRALYVPAIVGASCFMLFAWLVPVSHVGVMDLVPRSELASVLIEFAGSLLFFLAGWRLTEKSVTEEDSFISWIAAGCVFGGFAMVSSGLFGVQNGDWIQTSDIFRMALVCTWAWGSVIEIRQYWSSISTSSWRRAQRSVALDLHDGIAQELALITSYLYAPALERTSPEWHRQVQATAARALCEIRETITVLAAETLEVRVSAAHEHPVTRRVVETEHHVTDVSDRQRESFVRIAREAVTNSLRHGQANTIRIQVSNDGRSKVLRIFDDGVGFDPTMTVSSGRLGIVSMREQANAVGASLLIHSTPGQGAIVEVRWP